MGTDTYIRAIYNRLKMWVEPLTTLAYRAIVQQLGIHYKQNPEQLVECLANYLTYYPDSEHASNRLWRLPVSLQHVSLVGEVFNALSAEDRIRLAPPHNSDWRYIGDSLHLALLNRNREMTQRMVDRCKSASLITYRGMKPAFLTRRPDLVFILLRRYFKLYYKEWRDWMQCSRKRK